MPFSAVVDSLAEAYDMHASADPMLRKLASKSASDVTGRLRALLHMLVAYDTTGTGALSASDFGRLLRGELGAAALPTDGSANGLPKADLGVNDKRAARMHARADSDGDGFVDWNELVQHVAPHRARTTGHGGPPLLTDAAAPVGVSTAADLCGRAAVHLAGSHSFQKKGSRRWRALEQARVRGSLALGAESLADANASGGEASGEEGGGRRVGWGSVVGRLALIGGVRSGGSGEDGSGQEDMEDASSDYSDVAEGARTLRTLAREVATRKRDEDARKAKEEQERAEKRLAKAAEARDAKALRSSAYVERLRSRLEETVGAGYEDHTATLSPRSLKHLCGQLQRFDSSGEGRLNLDDFCALCSQIGRAAVHTREAGKGGRGFVGEEESLVSRLQMMALFSQADVTGAHHICLSQWAWARQHLGSLIEQQLRVRAAQRVRHAAAEEEALAAAEKEDKAKAEVKRIRYLAKMAAVDEKYTPPSPETVPVDSSAPILVSAADAAKTLSRGLTRKGTRTLTSGASAGGASAAPASTPP